MWLERGAPTIRCSPTRCGSTWRRVEPALAGPEAAAGPGAAQPRSTRSSTPISPRNLATSPRASCPPRSRSRADATASTISAMATSSSPRSPAAPTPPTPRCWSPPAWSRARRGRKGLTRKPWVKTSLAPGIAGGDRLSRPRRPQRGSERDRLRPGRLWLHHLHRQFGAAARGDQRGDQQERPGRRLASSPATAISRAGCRPTCAPIISPRRRWSSPMRSRARWSRGHGRRAARPGPGRRATSISRTSGRRTTRSAR